jgi:hypothetical protein
MKSLYLLLFVLCLAIGPGCATHHKKSKAELDFRAAIQHVVEARADIRTVISHSPRNAAELNDIAQMDPNALIFNVQDFAQRLQTISLKGCPADFRVAFENYVAAWNARAAANPALLLLLNAGPERQAVDAPPSKEPTEVAWQAVQTVITKHTTDAD